MKSFTLKLKSIFCALALLGTCSIKADSDSFLTSMQEMSIGIKSDYEAIEALIEEFISKETPKGWALNPFVDKCLAAKDRIKKERLEALKSILDTLAATHPGTKRHAIVQKTYELACDVYKKMESICIILDAHRKSKDWNNAPKLITPLKPKLEELIAPATLDLFAKRLVELEALLNAEGAQHVTQELTKLKALIVKIKNQSGKLKNELADLYKIISSKLKKLNP